MASELRLTLRAPDRAMALDQQIPESELKFETMKDFL